VKERILRNLIQNELDLIKNNNINPQLLTIGSHKNVWWLCKNGHSYKSKASNRVNGKGCRICANRIVLEGFNDLKTLNPKIAKAWSTKTRLALHKLHLIQAKKYCGIA
jgi:hypothetical protein